MNKIILMGRLTKDPEITSTASGTTIARFSIAVDRRFKREGDPEADFFSCNAFGKTAEFIERYLKKGTKVTLDGRMENNNYTNKEGQKVYDNRVIVNEIEFAESKNAASNNAAQEQQTSSDDFLNVPDGLVEELPFS